MFKHLISVAMMIILLPWATYANALTQSSADKIAPSWAAQQSYGDNATALRIPKTQISAARKCRGAALAAGRCGVDLVVNTTTSVLWHRVFGRASIDKSNWPTLGRVDPPPRHPPRFS